VAVARGLSQVSKDWRITFFSNAARIWSQGLRAELGEVAKAIEHFLEFRRLRNVTPVIQRNSATDHRWRKMMAFRLACDDQFL